MNIFLNEYFGFCFELNFELNHFSARFNEKMNFQNVSPRAMHGCVLCSVSVRTQTIVLIPGDGHLPPTVLQPAALHHLHLTDEQHKPNSTVHFQRVQPADPLNSKRDYPPDQVFVPPHHLALSCQPPPSIHHPAHSPCLLLLCFQSVGNKL